MIVIGVMMTCRRLVIHLKTMLRRWLVIGFQMIGRQNNIFR